MTDDQINDYLRKYEFQEYNQLQVVTKEEQLLKKIQVRIQKLKAERNVRNSRKQLKIGGQMKKILELSEILKTTDKKPLFGNKRSKTHWLVFMKDQELIL